MTRTLPPVVYDLSRLITRFSRSAPNGIDRVDLGYAGHFLTGPRRSLGALLGPRGPRSLQNDPSALVVRSILAHWHEERTRDEDPVLTDLINWLRGPNVKRAAAGATCRNFTPARAKRQPLAGIINMLAAARREGVIAGQHGLWPGQNIVASVPQGAIYLNTSQFPLWMDWYFRWLDKRPDVKAVFFVHDLLPLDFPEFFPKAEERRHQDRLEVLANRADGIIVSSDESRKALAHYLKKHSRRVPPITAIPLPSSPAFDPTELPCGDLLGAEYFVCVGTLEPRKNHLLLLHVWRELQAELGPRTPRLVLVGHEGWHFGNARNLLDRCDALAPHVCVAQGLSSPALATLMTHARAVLMPTFAEGFGLPVIEALSCGAPVIAAKISPFEEYAKTGAALLDPIDGLGWRDAVKAHTGRARQLPKPSPHDLGQRTWLWHMEHVEWFLHDLIT